MTDHTLLFTRLSELLDLVKMFINKCFRSPVYLLADDKNGIQRQSNIKNKLLINVNKFTSISFGNKVDRIQFIYSINDIVLKR